MKQTFLIDRETKDLFEEEESLNFIITTLQKIEGLNLSQLENLDFSCPLSIETQIAWRNFLERNQLTIQAGFDGSVHLMGRQENNLISFAEWGPPSYILKISDGKMHYEVEVESSSVFEE